jgi:hypothetical protein
MRREYEDRVTQSYRTYQASSESTIDNLRERDESHVAALSAIHQHAQAVSTRLSGAERDAEQFREYEATIERLRERLAVRDAQVSALQPDGVERVTLLQRVLYLTEQNNSLRQANQQQARASPLPIPDFRIQQLSTLYHAFKEMLQNGVPGSNLLIESGDMRDVVDGRVPAWFVIVTSSESEYPIDDSITHVRVIGTIHVLYDGLLMGCSGLTRIDLSPLSQVTKVGFYFLSGCSGLTSIDLGPLKNVTEVGHAFLQGCSRLTGIDLSPLSNVTKVGSFFLAFTGLTGIDLNPLSKVTEVGSCLLEGCAGIAIADLAPDAPPSLRRAVAEAFQ